VAKQYFIPGVGVINDDGSQEYIIPGGGVVNESSSVVYSLSVESGSFILTGTVIVPLVNRKLVISSGSFVLIGTAIDLVADINPIVQVESGSFNLTGSTIKLLYNRKFSVNSGSFTLSGTDIGLSKTLYVNLITVEYELTLGGLTWVDTESVSTTVTIEIEPQLIQAWLAGYQPLVTVEIEIGVQDVQGIIASICEAVNVINRLRAKATPDNVTLPLVGNSILDTSSCPMITVIDDIRNPVTAIGRVVVGMNTYTGRVVNLTLDALTRAGTYDDNTDISNVSYCYGVTLDADNNIAYAGENFSDGVSPIERIVKIDLTTMTMLDSLTLASSNHENIQAMADCVEDGYVYALVVDTLAPFTATLYEISVDTFTVTRSHVFTGPRPSSQSNGLYPDSVRGYIYYRGTGDGSKESYIHRLNLSDLSEDATTVEVGKGHTDGYYYGIYSAQAYDKNTGLFYCAWSSTESPIGIITKSSISKIDVDTMTVLDIEELADVPIGGANVPTEMTLSEDLVLYMPYRARVGGVNYVYVAALDRDTLDELGFIRIGPIDGTYPEYGGALGVFDDTLVIYCPGWSSTNVVAIYQTYDLSSGFPVLDDTVIYDDILGDDVQEAGSTAQMVVAATAGTGSIPETISVCTQLNVLNSLMRKVSPSLV
jgi:hypothetical protein